MNIHINQYTQFQTWDKKKIFDEYPFYIKRGKYTVSMFFNDKESMTNLIETLKQMLWEIEDYEYINSIDTETIPQSEDPFLQE